MNSIQILVHNCRFIKTWTLVWGIKKGDLELQWVQKGIEFLLYLTPKGPDCVFWLYKNFGHVRATRDSHNLGRNFSRRWGRGISFICTKFHDIWKYESKVMA